MGVSECIKRAEFHIGRLHFSGCKVDIPFHHFERSMPQDRLQSVKGSVRTLLFMCHPSTLAVGGIFDFVKAVVRKTVFKQACLFFGGLFIHTDIDKSLLEIAVTFINLFGNRTTGVGQMQQIVFCRDKAAAFQK